MQRSDSFIIVLSCLACSVSPKEVEKKLVWWLVSCHSKSIEQEDTETWLIGVFPKLKGAVSGTFILDPCPKKDLI